MNLMSAPLRVTVSPCRRLVLGHSTGVPATQDMATYVPCSICLAPSLSVYRRCKKEEIAILSFLLGAVLAPTYLVVALRGMVSFALGSLACVLRLQEAAGAYDAEARRVFGDTHPVLNFPVSLVWT